MLKVKAKVVNLDDEYLGIVFDDDDLEEAGLKEGDVIQVEIRKTERP
jgi:hypothetical protein